MASSLAVQAYDTLSIARNLEHDYAFDKRHAEGIARTIHEHLVSNVATKDDLDKLRVELRGEMAELRGEMAELRGEMAELRGEMAELRVEMVEMRTEFRGEIVEMRTEFRVEMVEMRTEFRGEIVEINNRIGQLEKTLTIRTGAMIAAAVGAVSALQALIS